MVVVVFDVILLYCDVGDGPDVSTFIIFPMCSFVAHVLVESTISVVVFVKEGTSVVVAVTIRSNVFSESIANIV